MESHNDVIWDYFSSSVKTGIIHQTEDTFTAAAGYYPDN